MSLNQGPVSAQVLDAAIAWQLSLDGQPAATEQEAFARWHAANEEHARAWRQLGMLDQRFSAAAGPARKALMQSRESLRRRIRSTGRGVLGVLLVGGFAVFSLKQSLPFDYWLADESTATGERRLLQLSDGTRIELNTHSAIDVRFDAHRRVIALREGEIMIRTGHPDPRPFVVETADGRLRALGTEFLVRQEAEGTRLGVLQSAVAARPEKIGEERVVRQGQQAFMHAAGLDEPTSLPPGSDAWTHGMLVVENMRLADLAVELGRYRPGVLRVTAEVADLRVTGSFPLDDTDLALKALLPTLPVQIEQHTRWWTTLSAKPLKTS